MAGSAGAKQWRISDYLVDWLSTPASSAMGMKSAGGNAGEVAERVFEEVFQP